MQHDVVTVAAVGLLGTAPGQDHRAVFPGLARQRCTHLVHHAVFVHVFVLDDKFIRIDDDFDPVVVEFEVKVQHQQAGLRRDDELHFAGHLQTARAADRLAVEKQRAQLTQPELLVGREQTEEGETRHQAQPLRIVDRLPLDGACAAPAAEPAADAHRLRRHPGRRRASAPSRFPALRRRVRHPRSVRSAAKSCRW